MADPRADSVLTPAAAIHQRLWTMPSIIAATAMFGSLALSAAPTDSLVARCRALQQQPQAAIAACEAAFAQHAGDSQVDVAQEMLFRRSDAEIAIGAFDTAQVTLERAALLPGAGDAWKSTYRLQRRRGILDYRRGQFPAALSAFSAARDLAASNGDAIAEGNSWNDLGNALRRIGSYREALEAYLASLQRKRSTNDAQLGGLMTNLGDLYRDLNDAKSSRDYYLQALDLHQRRGRTLDVAHTHEALATLALDTRDFLSARKHLDLAATTFHTLAARSDEIRVAARVARLGLDSDDVPTAQRAVAHGIALAQALKLPITPDLALEAARLALLDRDAAGAERLTSEVLARLAADAPERVALLKLRAEALDQLGRVGDAYRAALQFQQADAALRDAEHDRRLEQLRVRFDVAEKDRALGALTAQARLRTLTLQQRTAQLKFLAVSAVLVVSLIGFLAYRARERLRVAASLREAQLQSEAEHFRAAATALEGDMRRVQALLDRSEHALIALDLSSTIVAANRGAADALRVDVAQLHGRRLDEFIDAASAAGLSDALGRIDEGEASVDCSLAMLGQVGASPWSATLIALDDAGGASTVVQFLIGNATDTDAALPTSLSTPTLIAAGTDNGGRGGGDQPDMFRRELVELMVSSLAAWEQSTRSGAIELAERSRVWRVAIDDGRLRVRAMERYLSLAKIPRHPRWREVLRTTYYVLAEAPLDSDKRAELRQRCESVQALVRRRALH